MSSTSSKGPSGKGSREIASDPSTFRACCVLFAIDFCSGRSSVFSSTRWNGSSIRIARRSAKFGTSSGCRCDGIHVTHSGAGCGDHRAINSRQARTSSSANRPSRYLPRLTSPPQPASPQMQSARPGFATNASGMRPRTLEFQQAAGGPHLSRLDGQVRAPEKPHRVLHERRRGLGREGGQVRRPNLPRFAVQRPNEELHVPGLEPDVLLHLPLLLAPQRRESLGARAQNSSLSSAAVNCHLAPSFAIGAGDSSESSAIVFSIRPALMLTSASRFGTDRPSGADSSASSTCRTSSRVGNALSMK